MSTSQEPIASVTLRVRDLERSTAFYGDVLGLGRTDEVTDDEAMSPRRAAFAAPGDGAPIVELIEAPDARPKPARALGLYHFALLVPDRRALGAALLRLRDAGVRLQGASDHAVSEALYLADPDGHGIEIYRDRPPDMWSYKDDGELYMTTQPLDLGAVAAEADRGAGLPVGTVIGHIHLHISNMQKAEAFYVEDLGFDVMVGSYPGALFLSTGGYHHHVGLNTWAGPHAAPPDAHTIGMAAFAMRAPRAHAAGTVADPDGIRIHIL